MSNWPFRFVHAADFHLEQPPFGVSDVPDHLAELFIESAYLAAERVFETVLAEQAEFLVLSGDLLDPRRTGPRGLLFLVEQFTRLAERDVAVYWAGGRTDPPDAWPAAVRLPDNVHVFAQRCVEEHVHHRDGEPLARVMGISRMRGRGIRASDFAADPAGLFTVAVVHGTVQAESIAARGLDYWALGGSHARHTLFSSPHVAHYPGSPQGRWPDDCGAHGCTLVQVDPPHQARTTLAPTDLMRWETGRVAVDEATTLDDLQGRLRERMQSLVEANAGVDLLVSWKVVGDGPLLAQLRRGTRAGELVQMLRDEYGYGPPAAWSVSLSAEPAAVLPPEWYEQQTIRGDFLRQLRHYQMNASEPLDLESFLADPQLDGALASAAQIPDQATRDLVLREAALLGVDLLSGEEPDS